MNPDRKRRKADHLWWLWTSGLISTAAVISYMEGVFGGDDDPPPPGAHVGEQSFVMPSPELQVAAYVAVALVLVSSAVMLLRRRQQAV